MKILWLVNIVMPELAVHMGQTPSVFGGWLTGALEAVRAAGHHITVCTVAKTSREVRWHADRQTTYLLLEDDAPETLSGTFRHVLGQEQPDLVHIWGTEFAQSWALASVSDPARTLVSVQGLVHTFDHHARAGIPEHICRTSWLHKLYRALGKHIPSIDEQRQSFARRAETERKVLARVGHVNGGTAWGDSCARLIQPGVRLHECGLILRSSFYGGEVWDPDACVPHSVFALYTYPIKGFHKLLEALVPVVRRYPDTRVFVAGNRCAFRNLSGLKRKLMDLAPDYDWYVQGLIEKYGLKDNLEFLGYLSEEQMKQQLLRSSVFVSPSSIENHSTMLGEAMITGVPSIASCVGGLQEMVDHGVDGFLYPFNEPYTLAGHILRLFEDRELAMQFSRRGRAHAAQTYDREGNCRRLLEIYETIGGGNA